MRHGTENEINALATLHSKVLPSYFPNLSYYEEGIRIVKTGSRDIIGVSPDGSIRASQKNVITSENITFAVEVKCPMSVYNTPVYYKIPERYICQVMLEMRALGCKECLFVCWSEESSTVFRVRIKQRLIALILNETMDVYYGDNKTAPSRENKRNESTLQRSIRAVRIHW
ncbi:unnamed protein product [Mytilus edulis]|uniref:YqaJ viral recombinase domain-containing protein n=1 Tax=Mytilus edulis TaxID=6550 RepID=A0A8S3TWC7_MYTED|nr:unnamed protein product [Mytilus edulis]